MSNYDPNPDPKHKLRLKVGQLDALAAQLGMPPYSNAGKLSPIERHALHALGLVASAAYNMADDGETKIEDGLSVTTVIEADLSALSDALDMFESLPDDKPGFTMSGPQKANWALRHIIARDQAGVIAEDPDEGLLPADFPAVDLVEPSIVQLERMPASSASLQGGSPTGRISRSEPNIQEFPESTAQRVELFNDIFGDLYGPLIERVLIQKEDGRDIHKLAASQKFCVPYEEVTQEQRNYMKRSHFFQTYNSPLAGSKLGQAIDAKITEALTGKSPLEGILKKLYGPILPPIEHALHAIVNDERWKKVSFDARGDGEKGMLMSGLTVVKMDNEPDECANCQNDLGECQNSPAALMLRDIHELDLSFTQEQLDALDIIARRHLESK